MRSDEQAAALPVELTDWQLNRVRDALRAYHRYERGRDGAQFFWKDVREAIAEYTGYEISSTARDGAERLRQFVEGNPDRNNPGHRICTDLRKENLQAALAFVTHKELNLLSMDELERHEPEWQAPLRLSEFLSLRFDTKNAPSPKELEGTYRTSAKDEDDFVVRELVFQRPYEHGFVEAVETEDIYDGELHEDLHSLSLEKHRNKRRIRHHRSGWAILTPEYNLLVFLKEERTGMNRYYFSIAANATQVGHPGTSTLVLLLHDFVFELEDNVNWTTEGIRTEVTQAISDNMLVFERRRTGA